VQGLGLEVLRQQGHAVEPADRIGKRCTHDVFAFLC
jgi:hypothetical protein